ncbi:uncharacterized protein LOC131032643 isoform X1 [Cryptomeria japonica]|uniref:uncharacterized protein LOC131032643 isoform X1 n=1 Tax=Cryptomeria japonica TaxID=3369 RepID=UPI0027DA4E71|nr:uncharacterized protein LOC131032643 isoform X1 [Cryptomeria japonica]
MDKSLVKLEVDFEDMDYAIDSSSQHGVSLLRNSQSLYTPRDLDLDEHIADNEEDGYDPPEANRFALDKAKSLSFETSIIEGKKNQGKDSGTDYLIPYHNHRLRGILEELSSQHRWKECAGVLSALLKGMVHDIYFFRHQFKYWAAMETLRQIDSNQGNERKFNHLFELLWKKQPDPKHAINKKLRPSIQLEKVLYFISQGRLDDASLNSKEFLKEEQFRDDPVANMVYGLIVYQKWFDAISKRLHLKEHDMIPLTEDMEMDSLDAISKSYQSVQNSHPNISGEEKLFITLDSDSSIGNGKEIPKLPGHHSSKKQCCRGPLHGTSKKIYVQGFNEETDEDVSSHDLGGVSGRITVLCSTDLDRILFPIRLPATHEKMEYMIPMEVDEAKVYHEALKHFEVALSSSPPLLAALVPYLQLLLANGQVKETLKKIENLCQDSNHLLLFSLRARLAESLTPKQPTLLGRCYEELLSKNPASDQSIKCLVKLHKKGSYQTDSLVECIALHLDAAHGHAYIWRELASCFQEIQAEWQAKHENDDRLSTEQGNYSDIKYGRLTFSNQLPRMFCNSQLRSNWMLRCKWWAGRHFSKDRIHLEQQEAGNWELVTFKAACATHILGPKFGYVKDIYAALESMEETNMLSLLKPHIHCSLRLKKHLYKR